MLKFEEDSFNKVFVVTINGFIDKDDARNYLIHLKKHLDDWKKIKEVKIIKNFNGIDFFSFLKILWFHIKYCKQFEKKVLITQSFYNGFQGLLALLFSFFGYFFSLFLILKFRRYHVNNVRCAKIWLDFRYDKYENKTKNTS